MRPIQRQARIEERKGANQFLYFYSLRIISGSNGQSSAVFFDKRPETATFLNRVESVSLNDYWSPVTLRILNICICFERGTQERCGVLPSQHFTLNSLLIIPDSPVRKEFQQMKAPFMSPSDLCLVLRTED